MNYAEYCKKVRYVFQKDIECCGSCEHFFYDEQGHNSSEPMCELAFVCGIEFTYALGLCEAYRKVIL